ncbi:gp53-like domain-containing protein [Providencia rustigianii]|uniref:gp53-like domain-containing protein n=1 Tax=Providencia rustigianii TaxID=158850 RepID=UPI00223FE6CF|nr:hypothetical protein [Providencia rustigianii]
MTKTFKVPFATQGDRTSIPNEMQADGAVSYTQGYGYDYERDQVSDPAAKDIEREKMNGIFHDITEAIGELQSFGFPKWATEGTPYPIRAIVYHKNKTWQSTIENNNIEPVAGKAEWRELKADLNAGDINVYNKTESDQRFQPLGNYLVAGYSYSKAESDTNYQPKGNYAPAGNYALKGESYTKVEGDGRYQPKGNYQPSGDYATNTALTNGLNTKLNTSSIVQSTGTSTSTVMSQKAVANALDKYLAKDQNGADIPDKTKFMENIGLGDAAKRSVGIGANQIPDMSSFTSSLSGSGWQKLPSGLIIQWGSYTATANGITQFNFPTAFPLACVGLLITRHQPGSNEAINGSPISRTAFAVQDYANGNEVFSMMAIGY